MCGRAIPVTGTVVAKFHPVSLWDFYQVFLCPRDFFKSNWLSGVFYKGYKPGVGLAVRVVAWDRRILSSSPVSH